MDELDDKVAFVTGGSSGIGLGIARACLDAGMKVAIGYRTTGNAIRAIEELADASGRVHAIEVDVTDRRSMQRAAEETVRIFGKVHVLVSNAGVGLAVPLIKATHADWDWVLGVNLTGAFNGVHAFLPHIQSHGEGGHIVATSSVLGLIAASNDGVYTASKFGVVGLIEALRAELAGTGIGASVVVPGIVRSEISGGDRNRPAHLAHTARTPRTQKIDKSDWMDPMEVGRIVVRGVRSNHLYIVTHPEFEQGIRERCEAVLAAIPKNVEVPAERVVLEKPILTNAIYVEERDRHQRQLETRLGD